MSERVLALETATTFLSLGWLEGNAIREHTLNAGRAHAEVVVPALEAFMREVNATRAEVIAVGTGPGSYTGVRVGVSLALGLARGWNARVVGVPTLEAIAAQRDGLIAVTVDARKGNVYSALYRVQDGLILETLLEVDKRALEAFQALAPKDAVWLRDEAPSGAALARLGAQRQARGEHRLEISYL